MNKKIPADAFDFYVSLGPGRTYQAVATEYGVSKRAVTKRAATETWSERLGKIEAEAREKGDKKLAETLQEVRDRHLTTIRAMQARALSALQKHPLKSGMEAMKAAEIAIKLERLVSGEPTEHNRTEVEEKIWMDYRELMVDGEDAVEEGAVP